MSALLLAATLVGCNDDVARLPSRSNFTAALSEFLAQRGHLCLAKYEWPITVASGSDGSDAKQLSVLEKLGLVASEESRISLIDAQGAVTLSSARHYSLTAAGHQYYLRSPVSIRTAIQSVTYPGDLCAATLTLNRLVGWDPPLTRAGRTATSLLFTYRLQLADWARAPEFLQVFPVVVRAVQNEGVMQLRVGVHLSSHGWVADELDD